MSNDGMWSEKRKICAYRSADGAMCAIGCLIDDKQYKPAIENHTLHFCSVKKAVEKSIGKELDSEDVSMLVDLQAVHDKLPVASWKEHLGKIATQYKLV